MNNALPETLEMMRELVACPSVSCIDPALDQSNAKVIDTLAGWLEPMGFGIEIQQLPDQPGKCNMIATLGTGDGGLVLSGHTDTVPYDVGGWRFDPFSGEVHDDKLYGLGTADMKSFLAMATVAASQFKAGDLKQPLIILATADEETSMSGAQALVEAGYPRAGQAIVGEPTSLRPINMHKGASMRSIKVIGHSGHSSDPGLGNNALDGMHKVMGEIIAFRDELKQRYTNPLFAVPYPTLNLGVIHGGDNPNRICSHCDLQIDIRPLPGMDLKELLGLLEQRLEQVLTGSGLGLEITPLFEGMNAMETPLTAPLIQAAIELTGREAEAVAYCTEAPYLQALGMDTMILGPGSIDQAHQPDEFITLESIDPTVDLLGRFIERFCVNEAPAATPA